ncbi:condensation domain-containing protein (plasmid) [Streptomyces sp. FXJ1.172]|uniref:condensation domain-containing protein n=1 Tax=Streptomyces sp. FXJ1.172 TaxID=710705 RepID=UPI0023DD0457|nr:condensation domain-containing protein [Streptomyces sp. FXJ1.172]WEP01121.1 condensation domain-containing protein [Streptomyces sp. FXJ1.172]
MTSHRVPQAPVSVIVAPGPSPHPVPWDLELRGPLDEAALERLLEELTAGGDPDRPGWRHRLLRHGPDHHTLRFSAPQGAPVAFVAGRVADHLTAPPPPADRPLTPAQRAALAREGERRYEAMVLDAAAATGAGASPDAGALRAALDAVVAVHPQLRSRLAGGDGWHTARAHDAARSRQERVVEGEFTDEAGFAALVDAAGRTLDAYAGDQLRVLLARDRRTDGARADRIAVVALEPAVDAASWRILLDDLTAALAAATGGTAPRPEPDGLAEWVTELRALASDVAEAQHWSLVAERRARAARAVLRPPQRALRPADGDSRTNVRVTGADDGPAVVPAGTPDTGFVERADETEYAAEEPPGGARHTGFTLGEDATERIAQGLAGRLALTAGQVLTGAFALALARWQGTDEVGFDVRSDPRGDRPGLRRLAGRLAEPYPVQFALGAGAGPVGQLTELAGALAACAGLAGGGAGFGACREWSPDPQVRRTLRELAPARVCLAVDDAGGPLPDSARPMHRGAHPVEVRAEIRSGRLRVGLDWPRDPAHGVTDASAGELACLLREVLEELAAAPAAPIPRAFLRATPQQSVLYTGGDARPGTGRHVEQLVWVWRGPLDVRRFTRSWQSVFDCETVLRTAFTDGPEPLLVVHERVVPEITRRAFPDGDWSAFLEGDRLRGFDLRRPGALRFTLLETERTRSADPVAPTRILVTYHRALLDTWSAHLLLREFYRAYLAGGTLPGGERRPDLRDYTAWVAAQDPEPARGFWAASAPPVGAASWPVRSAARAGLTGVGRARLRLDPVETTRLAHWAGTWGTAESSVLQTVWAILIYWASGATGPAPVCFAVTVSGRGIALDGADRMPGPLRNPLPMTVEVDPAGTVPRLLRQLRDRALDMAAYEWVPADWIRAWRSGADPGTVIVFEDPPHPLDGLEAQLAAHGIHAELPDTLPARSVLPIGLLAHHDSAGGLVLTGVHDRALLDEEAAAELLAQCALLLRSLPLSAGEATTVGEALELLEESAVPGLGDTGRDTPLVTLRAARRERAGTICLIPPPGAPETCYDLLASSYPGPQQLLLLTAGADPDRARSALATLRTARSLLFAGFSGAGVLACDLARRIAADGGRPPRVVLAGACADERERFGALAQVLLDATGPGV